MIYENVKMLCSKCLIILNTSRFNVDRTILRYLQREVLDCIYVISKDRYLGVLAYTVCYVYEGYINITQPFLIF